MVENDYYSKYLKYKIKYIKQKNLQIGSANPRLPPTRPPPPPRTSFRVTVITDQSQTEKFELQKFNYFDLSLIEFFNSHMRPQVDKAKSNDLQKCGPFFMRFKQNFKNPKTVDLVFPAEKKNIKNYVISKKKKDNNIEEFTNKINEKDDKYAYPLKDLFQDPNTEELIFEYKGPEDVEKQGLMDKLINEAKNKIGSLEKKKDSLK